MQHRLLLARYAQCCALLLAGFCGSIPLAAAEPGEPALLPELRPSGSLILEAPAPMALPEPNMLPPRPPVAQAVPPGEQSPVHSTGPSNLGHEVWLISTRELATDCNRCDAFQPRVARLICDTQWQEVTLDEFLQTNDQRLTMLLVHGNRTSAEESVEQGLLSFRRLVAEGCDARAVRFVIWSWPSDTVGLHVVYDARVKACRTVGEARYVAQFLNSIPATTPVTTIGFSFGVRVISGALHLLGGGELGGMVLDRPLQARQAPVHALFIGGAIDQDWLVPGRVHGQTLSQVDRLFITYNPRDIVLRYYPLLCRRLGVEALGYEGLAGQSLMGPELLSKIEQRNITSLIQRRHAWTEYLDTPAMMTMLRDEALRPATSPSLARVR
jgi:hypothetical protein